MKLNLYQAFCYQCWLRDVQKVKMAKRLGYNEYQIKKHSKFETSEIHDKIKRVCGPDTLNPDPDESIGKLALWIYKNGLNWSKFGKKMKTCNLQRFLFMRWKNFSNISQENKEEIEKITDGYVKVEDWL